MEKINLNIPRLGGNQDFDIISQKEAMKPCYRYICSTWDDDGLDNDGQWDVLRNNNTHEYVALKG